MTKDKFYKIVLYIKNLINGTKFEGKTYVVGGAVRDLYMDKEIKDIDFAAGEKELAKVKAIIQSMTAKERKNPKLIVGSSSRKKRIAQGSGTSLQAVNKLIKGHEMMRKQFKSLTKKPGKKGLFGKLPF